MFDICAQASRLLECTSPNWFQSGRIFVFTSLSKVKFKHTEKRNMLCLASLCTCFFSTEMRSDVSPGTNVASKHGNQSSSAAECFLIQTELY